MPPNDVLDRPLVAAPPELLTLDTERGLVRVDAGGVVFGNGSHHATAVGGTLDLGFDGMAQARVEVDISGVPVDVGRIDLERYPIAAFGLSLPSGRKPIDVPATVELGGRILPVAMRVRRIELGAGIVGMLADARISRRWWDVSGRSVLDRLGLRADSVRLTIAVRFLP